jgi:hypothetical protein
MNTKAQIAIVVLLSLILAAIVIPSAVTYWQTNRPTAAVSPEPVLTVFQNKLVLEGYIRDHATHRWYRGSEAAAHGCRITGTVADATFNNCRLPLTGGIPDQD